MRVPGHTLPDTDTPILLGRHAPFPTQDRLLVVVYTDASWRAVYPIQAQAVFGSLGTHHGSGALFFSADSPGWYLHILAARFEITPTLKVARHRWRSFFRISIFCMFSTFGAPSTRTVLALSRKSRDVGLMATPSMMQERRLPSDQTSPLGLVQATVGIFLAEGSPKQQDILIFFFEIASGLVIEASTIERYITGKRRQRKKTSTLTLLVLRWPQSTPRPHSVEFQARSVSARTSAHSHSHLSLLPVSIRSLSRTF